MIIKDNRIVSDKTFAIRLQNFLKDIKVNDPASEEELEYLKHVAKELIIHQFDTVVDKSEKEYLLKCLPSQNIHLVTINRIANEMFKDSKPLDNDFELVLSKSKRRLSSK